MTSRRLERVEFAGPAGRMEGILHRGAGVPRFAAVVSHPHPLRGGGGTMDNKVTYRIARGLEDAGGLVLRYNFRGVGRSEGAHDEGRGEQADLKAALRELRARGGAQLPTLLAGFSFGSVMSFLVALSDPSIDALLLVGLPSASHALQGLAEVDRPLGIVQGDRDEHGPLPELQELFARLPEPKELRVVAGAGHFFEAQLPQLVAGVRWLVTEGCLSGALGGRTRPPRPA